MPSTSRLGDIAGDQIFLLEQNAQMQRLRALDALAHRLPVRPLGRSLLLKDVKVFLRDTTQWSQLILLAVLVVVYVFNIKFLPLRGEGVTFFLQNVIPFVNLILAGFVLASIAARFILCLLSRSAPASS